MNIVAEITQIKKDLEQIKKNQTEIIDKLKFLNTIKFEGTGKIVLVGSETILNTNIDTADINKRLKVLESK